MVSKRFQDTFKKAGLTALLFTTMAFNSIKAQDYKPKYNTIAHKALQIEDSTGVAYPGFKTIDLLIDNSKKYILRKSMYTREDIRKISKIIYEDIVKTMPEITKDSSKILPQKRIIDPSYRYTLAYLAIADANKLPIYVIEGIKDKLRYDRDGKHNTKNPKDPVNRGDININPLTGEIENVKKGSETYYLNKKANPKDNFLENQTKEKFLLKSHLIKKKRLAQENYIPKYNTLAHRALQIEDSVKIAHPSLKKLDEFIDSSKTYIPQKELDKYTKEDIKNISTNIYNHILKVYPKLRRDSIEKNTNEKIDACYRFTLFYLATGLFRPVSMPRHEIVRFDPNSKHHPGIPNHPDNRGDINIEVTTGEIENGYKYSDNFYIKDRCLDKKTLENNSYLRSSTDNEFLSYSYLLRVFPFLNDRIHLETLQDCNKAIKLDPKSATAYIVKGIVRNSYGEASNHVKALENFEKAFELNPTPKLYDKMISAYTLMQGPQEHEYDEKIFETASKGLDLIKQWRTKFKLEELPWGEDIQNYRLWKLETYFHMDRERYFKNKKDTISEKKEDEKIKYLLFEHKYGKMNVMFDILGLGYDF